MVDCAVDRPQDHRQGLVHKDEYDGYLRQLLGILQLLTPGEKRGGEQSQRKGEGTGPWLDTVRVSTQSSYASSQGMNHWTFLALLG